MFSLGISSLTIDGSVIGGDSTPGGASSVWMWEAGQGLLWESGSFMLTE